jgi:glucokinase
VAIGFFLLLFDGANFKLDTPALLSSLLFGSMSVLCQLVTFYSLRITTVALSNMCNTASVLIPTLFGIIVFKESFTLGTGIGGGIILDGKIWEGFNGFAAELGHMIIDVGGRRCACGLRGCLEAYCSASALVHETKRMMKLYPDSIMWELAQGDIERIDGRTAFAANARGDLAARQVIDDFVNYLAIGIANIINIFQPSVICIGGGVSGQGEELMRPLRERLKYTSFGTKDMRTRVEAAVYKNDAGIIGAGLLGIMED